MAKKLTSEAINSDLKAGKVGVAVVQIGDRLYLQATLPPKPGQSKPCRRISLGIYASQDGLSESRDLALKLGSDLARGRFSWDNWLKGSPAKPKGDSCLE